MLWCLPQTESDCVQNLEFRFTLGLNDHETLHGILQYVLVPERMPRYLSSAYIFISFSAVTMVMFRLYLSTCHS
jgi:hypothetical protein